MVETEKKLPGIAVNRDDDAGPAVAEVADVAMTRGLRALWITLLAAQVLIAIAVVLCLTLSSGQI
jgi:hypothetical protein